MNFKRVFDNLENYPTVHEFLGKRWLERMAKENNRTHPLLIFLSREPPNEGKLQIEIDALRKETNGVARYGRWLRIKNILWPSTFLEYLEEKLQLIVSKSGKLRDLKDGLVNEDQFSETISEIEVISSFLNSYEVEIAPELDGKKLDVKVKLNAENLLIEVINPNRFKPLRHLTGKAIGIKNRARDKIFDEFKHHLEGMKIEAPTTIAIDIGRSEIDYDAVADYLMGTAQLTMLFDKKTGEAVETFPSRAEDYMHALEKGTDVLSAVICYKQDFGGDLKFHKKGKVILNPHAKRPLSVDVVEKIEKALFI